MASLEYNILGSISKGKDSVKSFLEGAGKQDVVFNIASEGGSIFEGLSIAGIIAEYAGNTTAKGIGIVASAATIIMLAADKKVMTKNSFFMIHNASASVDGNATELGKTKDLLEKVDEQMTAIYVAQLASKGKLIDGSYDKTTKKVKEMMDAETWLSAEEAKDMGFIDDVVENTSAMTMNPFQTMQYQSIAAQYKNIPETVKNSFTMEKEGKKTLIQQIANLFGFKAEISDAVAEPAQTIEPVVEPTPAPIAEQKTDSISEEVAKKEALEAEIAKIEQQIAEKTAALEGIEANILAKSTSTYKAESVTEKKVTSKYAQETILKADAFMKSLMK
jgi:ATP-dependent protease ClpP protease subunit